MTAAKLAQMNELPTLIGANSTSARLRSCRRKPTLSIDAAKTQWLKQNEFKTARIYRREHLDARLRLELEMGNLPGLPR